MIEKNKLHLGDCLLVLRTLPDNSIDAVVTDPPYGLSFMGKKWDYDVPSVDVWAECLRVLKPGGHLLAFAGTRTQHRMAARIEDAGFEIRDMIAWVYGSGFPKSHNGEWGGTALKPALEPITVARKPLCGTVEENWRSHGTGALNIDACRIESEDAPRPFANPTTADGWRLNQRPVDWKPSQIGRWPANLIHDGSDDVVACFPREAGASAPVRGSEASRASLGRVTGERDRVPGVFHADTGSAARFFYCAKASKADRDDGLHGFDLKEAGIKNDSGRGFSETDPMRKIMRANIHPTVKPTKLMRYLCRLVTPRGGVVLDPFMGSGSTIKAAELEGFDYVGIEIDPDYHAIACSRVAADAPLFRAAA